MTIKAEIIADSCRAHGRNRITTMQLRYPKFIHGEFMTHRAFSRNASSSRAIPVERMIQDVMDDPAMPVFWGKNQPGMQAVEEMSKAEREDAIGLWLGGRDFAVVLARQMAQAGVHKQLVNRVIEPWCHINVVVTATEWDNFFALRCHKDAQPEMQALAKTMRQTMMASIPHLTQPGEWHLPYVGQETHESLLDGDRWEDAIKISVARCARVSYLTHDMKKPNIEDDLKLYERLVGSEPLHASPAEHQAKPDEFNGDGGWNNPEFHGNFKGWVQYRKVLERGT